MKKRSELVSFLEKFQGARVLVIGDILLDRYVTGKVERISPEAPIPVLHVMHEDTMLGGAGNVVRNLAALGVQATCISLIGEDTAGSEIRKLLSETYGARAELITSTDFPTPIKVRFLSGNQQILPADWESSSPSVDSLGSHLLKKAKAAMANCDAVVLSDYGKGVLSAGRSEALIDAAHDCGLRVIVDPKHKDYSIYRQADLVTPNIKELSESANMHLGTDLKIIEAAKYLQETHDIDTVLVTKSAKGMVLVDNSESPSFFPAIAREVFDVSGAGDTVVAAISAGVAAGIELTSAAAIANVAAGIVVGKVGTGVVRVEEIIAGLHHEDLGNANAKLFSWDKVRELAEIWRRQNFKIGFANGCFDLLHPGHVSLLTQSKEACNRLILGLNSDSSVKRLKGDGRPIQNEAARATVLASLAAVDAVVIFDQDTPIDLINMLRPDILFKGADYRMEDVIGADLVNGWGGTVKLVPLAEGHSTTNTLNKMAGK